MLVNFFLCAYIVPMCLCLFRSIKLPAVQQAVSHRKAGPTSQVRGKSVRGHTQSGRGRTRMANTRGTLKEIKEAVAQNKEDPLSSDPQTIDEDVIDEENNDDVKEEELKKERENKNVKKKNQTAKRGRPFRGSSGGGGLRNIAVTRCSINLDRDCVDQKNSDIANKKEEVDINQVEEKPTIEEKDNKQNERSDEQNDTKNDDESQKNTEAIDGNNVQFEDCAKQKENSVI